MVRIWESWLKNHPAPAKLPIILPIVLAQNAEVWKLPPQFSALLDIPSDLQNEVSPFVPDFTFQLIQLASLPFGSIRGTPAGIMTLRVMKAERIAKLLDDMVWDEALMMQLSRETLELLIRYMLRADIDKVAFDRKVRSITQRELQTTTMTLADQLREEGLQKGLQNAVIEALQIRFEDVPAGLAEAIRGIHDEARLHHLHKAAIQAATLETFTAAL